MLKQIANKRTKNCHANQPTNRSNKARKFLLFMCHLYFSIFIAISTKKNVMLENWYKHLLLLVLLFTDKIMSIHRLLFVFSSDKMERKIKTWNRNRINGLFSAHEKNTHRALNALWILINSNYKQQQQIKQPQCITWYSTESINKRLAIKLHFIDLVKV